MGRMRESWRQSQCTLIGVMMWFCETSLPFCYVLSRLKYSLIYIIFSMPMQILMVTPPAYMLHVDMPPSSMPPMHLTWHYHWGTICILFTLGNRCTFCYATHTTNAAYQRDLSVNMQHQEHGVSYHFHYSLVHSDSEW